MVTLQADMSLPEALRQASLCLRRGDLTGAEAALEPVQARGMASDPQVLNMLGVIRLSQRRPQEAAALFAQVARQAPNEAMPHFNLGRAQAALGAVEPATQAFRAALRLRPDFVEALYELGSLLHAIGELAEAERQFRQLLRVAPGHAAAKLMLGGILIDAARPVDAETVLRRGLDEATDPRMKAVIHSNLGMALRRQRKDDEALVQYEAALALDPQIEGIALHRAEALQNLKRHEEALPVLEEALAREPGNPTLHHHYNDLLYRLGRNEEYLKSYDSAPRTAEILLSKAFFLSHQRRGEEALEAYRAALALAPDDKLAAAGVGSSLTVLGRYGEAMAAFDRALTRHTDDGEIYGCAAEAAIQGGDPQKAAMLCEKALALNPHDQIALSILSTAWRVMEDERDETLSGYDSQVRIFDLEPPPGFSRMEDFNAELNAWLDRMHPQTREYLNQSLRGGTQTPDQLFGAGHELVEKIRVRIHEAVARYIAELKDDAKHPFLSRRRRDFLYSGSWSSRLRDCGFHVNHIHPQGWISSCYYVAVPEAVKDEQGRQGWIKFGEPTFDVPLKTPIRRAIQPAPGRLVLFPSFMWHGTVPFRDAQARTTIAFDVVPEP